MKIFLLFLLLILMTHIYAADIKKNISSRDPFVRPAHLILTQEDLYDYPLDNLKLLGVVQYSSQKIALVGDPKNHIYSVKLGDLIGKEKAKITDIKDDEIILEWLMQQQIFTDRLTMGIR